MKSLFSKLGEMFKPHNNGKILSMQYYNLKRKGQESAQELMGTLWIKDTDYKHKEYNRSLKEQFIYWLDDETIVAERIKQLMALKDTGKMSSEQVLMWAQRVEIETNRVYKGILDNIKDTKEDQLRRDRQKQG